MKLEIKSSLIPGAIMDRIKMGNVTGLEFLNKVFFVTDGIMLSQIREITGIDGSTLQNWTKRGFVGVAKNKRYNKNQLARILIINMIRDEIQLDRISKLLTYVNGRTEDESDDLIPESELYDYLCKIIDKLIENKLPPNLDNIHSLVESELSGYKEKIAGGTKHLERACTIIIMAYYASLISRETNRLYDEIFSK